MHWVGSSGKINSGSIHTIAIHIIAQYVSYNGRPMRELIGFQYPHPFMIRSARVLGLHIAAAMNATALALLDHEERLRTLLDTLLDLTLRILADIFRDPLRKNGIIRGLSIQLLESEGLESRHVDCRSLVLIEDCGNRLGNHRLLGLPLRNETGQIVLELQDRTRQIDGTIRTTHHISRENRRRKSNTHDTPPTQQTLHFLCRSRKPAFR